MQAHALTPRLVAALDAVEILPHAWEDLSDLAYGEIDVAPKFPFLSVLASGGHTLLIHSATLTDHEVLASTSDVAVGECLDKIARVVLPPDMLQEAGNAMYGALLERFAFPANGPAQVAPSGPRTASAYCQDFESRYQYRVPKNHEQELQRNVSRWGWAFNQPLAKAGGGTKNKSLEMSFSGLMTAVERAVRYEHRQTTPKLPRTERAARDVSREERRDMAEFSMRAAFEHIAARVVLALQSTPAMSVVVAGGVGANYYLRYVLACKLVAHGYGDVLLVVPPPHLCSDNAAMIAWTGSEMFRAGHQNKFSIRAIRKWPLDMLLSPPLERTT